MPRYLRIAFSAACAIACLLLIALWVQSYSYYTQWAGKLSGTSLFMASSTSGRFSFGYHRDAGDDRVWLINNFPIDNLPSGLNRPRPNGSRFGVTWQRQHASVHSPYWIVVLVAGMLSIAPAIPWSGRFSLRTLLMGMTLVAVVLGAVIYGAR